MRLWPRLLSFSVLVFGPACHGCGSSALRQAGATPYVRCLAGDPPELERKVGKASLKASGRVLSIEGLPRPTRIAAFRGPSPGSVPPEGVLKSLKGAGAHIFLVLGGLGDDDETAEATARALGSVGPPVLFVAGGTDRPGRTERALGAQGGEGRVVDATAFDAVRLGSDTLVPVAGAPNGSYALDDECCGYGLADLKERAGRLGEPGDGERRWLLAWGAPGGGGPQAVARDDNGLDLGLADLAELARRVGAAGGLFAWPAVQLGSARDSAGSRALAPGEAAADLRLVVPRLWGPPVARGDGSSAGPSFALLELREAGMALVAVEPVRSQ